ncbi:hypothetical protein [Embleya scabrispora]|uniref:hypothetical protein n=1 Tax=Embleya scabrispora TaxID=159449 RepID=UPI00039EE7D2|nr:hypothetical protein [Embleya scabrispora]MYS85914.1 hypothetical protein [Streptomyces sp. SID5474]
MSAPEAVDAYAAIHAARPGEVGAAADGWRLAAARLAELRDALAETGRRGSRIWTGGGAERFTARCHSLADAADRLAAQGIALHEHLDEAARALSLAQEHATDPTAAKVAAARLEGVYRDLGERLPVLPRPPRADNTSGATRPAAITGGPNPTRPCAAATAPPTDPSGSAGPIDCRDHIDTVDPASLEAVPTSTDTSNRPSPPSPAIPTASCEPPEPPEPVAVPAASEALAAPQAPAAPPPPPAATCMAAITPAALPPDPPTTPAAALPPPPAIACALPPAPPAPSVVGTPLPREPRQVHPAGIGPRVRRAAPPPSPPIAPVTGIRVAPGLRGVGGIGDRPPATHDAAHAAGPVPDLLGGTARDATALTPGSPTWVTTPTTTPSTGGALTTPSTSARPRPRTGSRYATHPAEAWWTDPQAPPQPT